MHRGRLAMKLARQRGFGLLQVFVLTVLIGGVLLAGFAWLQYQAPAEQAEDSTRALASADRALRGFAAAHYRLPCPDVSGDGREDCDNGEQKGRLPWRTLNLEDPALRAGIGTLGYMVDRTGADLAEASNRFNPGKPGTAEYRFSEASGAGEFHEFDQAGTPDFCMGLLDAGGETGTAVQGGDETRGVAYAVVHPGSADRDGSGTLFDGLNAASDPLMELPERSTDPDYDDQVLARNHSQIGDYFDCNRLMLALDQLSLASATVDAMQEEYVWQTALASTQAGITLTKMIVQITKLGIAVGQVIDSIVKITTAATQLAVAIGGCVFLVGCADIPRAVAGLVTAVAALVAAIASVVGNSVGVAANSVAFGLQLSVAIVAGVNIDDFDQEFDLEDLRDDIEDALDEAEDELDEAEDELADAEDDLADARDDYLDSIAAMEAVAVDLVDERNDEHEGSDNKPYSVLLNPVEDFIEASVVVEERRQAVERAEAALEQAEENLENLESDGDVDVPDDAFDALDEQIDDVQEELDNTSDPDEQTRLEAELDGLLDAREQLEGGLEPSDPEETSQAFQEALDEIDDQIQALEDQLDEDGLDDDEVATIEDRIDELEETRAELASSFAEIDTDVSAREDELQDAQGAFNSALSSRNSALNSVLSAFELEYEFETCEEDDEGEEECETETGTVEARDEIADAMGDFIEAIEVYYNAQAYRDEVGGEVAASRGAVEEVEAALDMLDDPDIDADGDPLQLWDPDLGVLEAADGKGGTR